MEKESIGYLANIELYLGNEDKATQKGVDIL